MQYFRLSGTADQWAMEADVIQQTWAFPHFKCLALLWQDSSCYPWKLPKQRRQPHPRHSFTTWRRANLLVKQSPTIFRSVIAASSSSRKQLHKVNTVSFPTFFFRHQINQNSIWGWKSVRLVIVRTMFITCQCPFPNKIPQFSAMACVFCSHALQFLSNRRVPIGPLSKTKRLYLRDKRGLKFFVID